MLIFIVLNFVDSYGYNHTKMKFIGYQNFELVGLTKEWLSHELFANCNHVIGSHLNERDYNSILT